MQNFLKNLFTLWHWRKRLLVVSYDAVAILFALWAAFSIRLDTFYWPSSPKVLLLAILAMIGGIVGLYLLGVYRIVVRYLDNRTIMKLLAGAALASVIWFSLVYLSGLRFLPRSVGLIYWALLFGLLLIGRQIMATLILHAHQAPSPLLKRNGGQTNERRNVAVFGANEVGVSLVGSLRGNLNYKPVFLIDSSPDLAGRTIASLRVYHSSKLAGLIKKYQVDEIFLAMPEATRAQRVAAIELLSGYPVKVKTVPSLAELAAGRFSDS